MALTTRQLCITQWILVAHEKHFFLSNNHKPVKIVELRSRILEELPTVPSWLSKIKKRWAGSHWWLDTSHKTPAGSSLPREGCQTNPALKLTHWKQTLSAGGIEWNHLLLVYLVIFPTWFFFKIPNSWMIENTVRTNILLKGQS